MSDNKKIIDKLNKLLRLAEQGIGGEKVTAKRMLDKILKKHNLTINDISDEVTEVYWFTYKGAIEKQLLMQIIFSVSPEADQYKMKNSKTKRGVKLTKREMLDIELRFSVYKESIKEDIEMLVTAFIQKNHIYPEDDEKYAKEIGEETPKEKAKRFRTAQIADSLNKSTILKGINKD